MSGISPNFNYTTIRYHGFERWRQRMLRISKPANIGRGVKKKPTLADVIKKRKRNVFVMAQLYGYKVKKYMTRHLDKILPKGDRESGIRWAPLTIPLHRRLQTLATFAVVFCGTILPVLSYILLCCLLYSQWWWLGILYIFYILHDHEVANRGGRRWDAFRDCAIHRYIAQYFPVRLVKTADLDPSKNYIAPTCPHGVLMLGPYSCFLTSATDFPQTFPGLSSYMAMTPSRFQAPFLRDINLFSGGISASEDSITYLLNKKNKGNFLCINLGGSAEAMESRPDAYKVIVKSRKGFARIALKTGASVVPVFSFGETRAFNTKPYPEGSPIRTWQDRVRQLTGFAPIAVRGRGFFQYNFGIIPFRTPITVVVGEPIDVKQNLTPTNEEIDELHNKYLEKLMELFDSQKHKYEADPTTKLVLM